MKGFPIGGSLSSFIACTSICAVMFVFMGLVLVNSSCFLQYSIKAVNGVARTPSSRYEFATVLDRSSAMSTIYIAVR